MQYTGVSGQYYRWKPCVENRRFVDYMKKVVSYGAEHAGVDGFHFDNGLITSCYCDRCQAAFRAEPGALEHTRIETTVNSKGDFVFHLFRIDNGRKLGPVTAELRDPRIKAGQTAQIRSFEPDVALGKCEISDGLARLEIYGLDTTASIVFR